MCIYFWCNIISQLCKLCLAQDNRGQLSSFWRSSSKSSSTCKCSFYVDDFLKSFEELVSAKELVKYVINMCKSDGFHLTKFIFKHKELLLSVPEHRRRVGVKDQDLPGDLPNTKASEICWDLKEDVFPFKLKLEAETITKSYVVNDKFNL